MSKRIAESINSIRIFWLKKKGFLGGGYRVGSLNWSCNGENRGSIGIAINLDNSSHNDYANLKYTHTDYWSEEKSEMDYNVSLESTPCNYGGRRYWFICPLSSNGRYCGRRVGVIYAVGKWFGCRHCAYIAYSSQMRGGRYRGTSINCPDIDKKESELKRWHYRGKPTRKYRRVISMHDKLNRAFEMMALRYGPF